MIECSIDGGDDGILAANSPDRVECRLQAQRHTSPRLSVGVDREDSGVAQEEHAERRGDLAGNEPEAFGGTAGAPQDNGEHILLVDHWSEIADNHDVATQLLGECDSERLSGASLLPQILRPKSLERPHGAGGDRRACLHPKFSALR